MMNHDWVTSPVLRRGQTGMQSNLHNYHHYNYESIVLNWLARKLIDYVVRNRNQNGSFVPFKSHFAAATNRQPGAITDSQNEIGPDFFITFLKTTTKYTINF